MVIIFIYRSSLIIEVDDIDGKGYIYLTNENVFKDIRGLENWYFER